MKIIILLTAPCLSLATSIAGSTDALLSVDESAVSVHDVEDCEKHASQFIKGPMKKAKAIQRAMDHCAMNKKVEDKNYVCPHYKQFLNAAFAREPTTRDYSAKDFCKVAEVHASEMQNAANVPRMGAGSGFEFEISKNCQPIVAASFGKEDDGKPRKTIPAQGVADFWYALCTSQDCAHHLPSRTRWCNHDHSPTHASSVCESLRTFARDEMFVMEKNLGREVNAKQVCSIYDEFVEDTHINTEAYLHVVHGKEDHPVPKPPAPQQALGSAQMKNEAAKNNLRDGAGSPTKSRSERKVAAGVLLALLAAFRL